MRYLLLFMLLVAIFVFGPGQFSFLKRIHVLAANLAVDSLEVNSAGSGSLRCSVSRSLRGTLTSSGNIRYSGDAQVEVEAHGSGKVIKE